MASKFVCSELYHVFKEDWAASAKHNDWKYFIDSKNLGVICISFLSDTYQITDHKKWMLTKIKYGI